MPSGIVTETCPAPKCNLADQDIHHIIDELGTYVEMFEQAFLPGFEKSNPSGSESLGYLKIFKDLLKCLVV